MARYTPDGHAPASVLPMTTPTMRELQYTGVSSEAQVRRLAKLATHPTFEVTITNEAMETKGPLHEGSVVRFESDIAPAGDYLVTREPAAVEGGWSLAIRAHLLDRDMEWNP